MKGFPTSSMSSSHTLCCCSENGRIIIVRKKLVAQFRCLIGLSSTFSLTHNYFCLDLGCEASHILRVSQDYGCVMCISDNLGHKSFFISWLVYEAYFESCTVYAVYCLSIGLLSLKALDQWSMITVGQGVYNILVLNPCTVYLWGPNLGHSVLCLKPLHNMFV